MTRRTLRDAVAVVTGAGRGIGAATARELAGRGAHVVVVGDDATELAALADDIDATPIVADVRDVTHAERVVRQTLDARGRLDVVVANAGIGHAGDFVDMTPDRIDDLLSINVRAPILLARAALPTMLAQGNGALVFVSSIAGVLLVPRESVYSASKAAIEAFAEPLRAELRGTGVTVSTVLPGVVDTAFFAERGEPYLRRRPRPQPPERVAAAIARASERGTPRTVVPPWLAVPIRVRALSPSIYRALSRRFG